MTGSTSLSTFSLVLLFTLGTGYPAIAQDNNSVATNSAYDQAEILRTQEFVFHSELIDSDFLIQVAAPFLFASPSPDQKFPVIYVTDGATNFSSFVTPSRMLPLEGSAQAAYIVGIGYPTDDLLEQNRLRTRDLVHLQLDNIALGASGGGGGLFERFLLEELRTEIERRFPVDHTQAMLAGHSLGGLFAATVLRNNPDAFSGFMIGSPSLQFDTDLASELHLMIEEGVFTGKVFLGAGSNEGNGDKDTFAAMIAATNTLYEALVANGSKAQVRRIIFEDETHISVIGAWISHGIRYLLNGSINN